MKPKEAKLSHEELKRLLDYDPTTGKFTWRKDKCRIKAGSEAGFLDNGGYIRIRFKGNLHMAHRLAWFYVNKYFPEGDIDHINTDRIDNRIDNLRCATRAQNCQNQKIRPTNTSGFKGVYRHSSGGFVSQIVVNRKHRYLGYFATAEEASLAYVKASEELHKDWGRIE